MTSLHLRVSQLPEEPGGGPGCRARAEGTGKAGWRLSICLLLPFLSAAWLGRSLCRQHPLPLAWTRWPWPWPWPRVHARAHSRRCPQPWLRAGAGRSCCAGSRRPGLVLARLLNWSQPASVLAPMCWHRGQGGPLSGLLQAAMEKAGPRAGLPRRWPWTRGAPFDVSGGQVTLTFSSYAAVSVI